MGIPRDCTYVCNGLAMEYKILISRFSTDPTTLEPNRLQTLFSVCGPLTDIGSGQMTWGFTVTWSRYEDWLREVIKHLLTSRVTLYVISKHWSELLPFTLVSTRHARSGEFLRHLWRHMCRRAERINWTGVLWGNGLAKLRRRTLNILQIKTRKVHQRE